MVIKLLKISTDTGYHLSIDLRFIEQMKSYIETPSLAGPSEFIEEGGEADSAGAFSAAEGGCQPVYTNVGIDLCLGS